MKTHIEESIFILQGRFMFWYLFFLKRISLLPLASCKNLILKWQMCQNFEQVAKSDICKAIILLRHNECCYFY